MKFTKVKNAYMFSKYVREDGKYTITSTDRRINGTLKGVFVVTDENDTEVDVMMKLKDAKAKYSE
jgi:hypothetical protein